MPGMTPRFLGCLILIIEIQTQLAAALQHHRDKKIKWLWWPGTSRKDSRKEKRISVDVWAAIPTCVSDGIHFPQ